MLLSLRAEGDSSERARPCLAGAVGGGAYSLLSRSVVSEISEKATAPPRGTRPCWPKEQEDCAEFEAERLAGRPRGEGPLAQGPSCSRFPARALVAGLRAGTGGVGSMPTDGGRECSPSRMQGE